MAVNGYFSMGCGSTPITAVLWGKVDRKDHR